MFFVECVDFGQDGMIFGDLVKTLEYKSSWSYVINDKLRHNYVLSKDDQDDMVALEKTLEELPNYTGNVSRFLYFNKEEDLDTFIKGHQVDNIITYKEYISTTVYGNIYNRDAQVIIYILDAKKGKDLTKYLPEEKEVLYPRNSSFDIINIEVLNNTYHILMEEV